VRITYLQPIDSWIDASRAHMNLPALDLPVSRTGVELYHSPRYRVQLEPGTFRVDSDPGVFAEALRAARERDLYNARGMGFGLSGAAKVPPPPMSAPAAPPVPPAEPVRAGAVADLNRTTLPADQIATKSLDLLVQRYRNESGGRTVRGALPVDVAFPSLGPSMFIAAELTAESQSPSIDLSIRRIKK
jgi:hypothetical protein